MICQARKLGGKLKNHPRVDFFVVVTFCGKFLMKEVSLDFYWFETFNVSEISIRRILC